MYCSALWIVHTDPPLVFGSSSICCCWSSHASSRMSFFWDGDLLLCRPKWICQGHGTGIGPAKPRVVNIYWAYTLSYKGKNRWALGAPRRRFCEKSSVLFAILARSVDLVARSLGSRLYGGDRAGVVPSDCRFAMDGPDSLLPLPPPKP